MRFLSRLRTIFAKAGRDKADSRVTASRGRRRPSVEALEDRTVPATVSSITSSFNGMPIASGRTLWFNSDFNVSGVRSSPVTLRVTDQTIAFRAGTTNYVVSVPDSIIKLSPGTVRATTSFDVGQNAWVTNLPSRFRGNAFLGGVAFQVTAALPRNIRPVTWTASFSTDNPGVRVNWSWGAAVYSRFGSDPNGFNVKPLQSKSATIYRNSDPAGTPEAFKRFLIRGGHEHHHGHGNFTGSHSHTRKVTPSIDAPPPPTTSSLSGHVVGSQNGLTEGIDGVIISLYDTNNLIVATTTTAADGSYSFTGLVAGTYTITETQPFLWEDDSDTVGSLGELGAHVQNSFTVSLAAGVAGVNYDFTEFMPANS